MTKAWLRAAAVFGFVLWLVDAPGWAIVGAILVGGALGQLGDDLSTFRGLWADAEFRRLDPQAWAAVKRDEHEAHVETMRVADLKRRDLTDAERLQWANGEGPYAAAATLEDARRMKRDRRKAEGV